jgi:hypothetical protein
MVHVPKLFVQGFHYPVALTTKDAYWSVTWGILLPVFNQNASCMKLAYSKEAVLLELVCLRKLANLPGDGLCVRLSVHYFFCVRRRILVGAVSIGMAVVTSYLIRSANDGT